MKKEQKNKLNLHDRRAVGQVKRMLTQHPAEKHTLVQLSKQSGLQRNLLMCYFKLLYGTSIHQYLLQQRILLARILLKKTNLPVKAISSKSGFGDSKHFISSFKKHCGLTPGEYQKQKRKG